MNFGKAMTTLLACAGATMIKGEPPNGSGAITELGPIESHTDPENTPTIYDPSSSLSDAMEYVSQSLPTSYDETLGTGFKMPFNPIGTAFENFPSQNTAKEVAYAEYLA